MNKIHNLFLIIPLVLGCFCSSSKSNTENLPSIDSKESSRGEYTIYLIRHAEKDVAADSSNPPLTNCGLQRADYFSNYFVSKGLMQIYSTDFTRTLQTAGPTATRLNLDIANYSPSSLESLAETIRANKENTLVVGHSETTSVLAGILSGQSLGPYGENDYDRIYIVRFRKGAKNGKMKLITSDFSCR